MNDQVLNMGIRRFLKEFGIAAQREIERAVEAAVASGKLDGARTIHARARLEIASLSAFLEVERDIPLEQE